MKIARARGQLAQPRRHIHQPAHDQVRAAVPPELEMALRFGAFAPTGTPPAVLARLTREALMKDLGLVPAASN